MSVRDATMSAAEFAWLAAFLNERSGLALAPDKRYLAEARLGPIARAAGLGSLTELVAKLARNDDVAFGATVVEAMATHETFFFRDGAPFKAFAEEMLPRLTAARAATRTLRIWSAACSTGQEPYSLAMLVEDRARELDGWRVEIVASDLVGEVVERARAGLYSQFEVQRGLPVRRLLAHFGQEAEGWRIAETLRRRVAFRTLNLKRDFSALGRFDVVFCRNALLYLDEATRADVLRRLSRQIAGDGYLVLGSAEAATRAAVPLRPYAGHPGVFLNARSGAVSRVAAR